MFVSTALLVNLVDSGMGRMVGSPCGLYDHPTHSSSHCRHRCSKLEVLGRRHQGVDQEHCSHLLDFGNVDFVYTSDASISPFFVEVS